MNTNGQLRDDCALRVPDQVLSRGAADETVILNLNNEQYFALDGVGSRLWSLVESGTTFGAAVDVLLEEYEVERDVLVADLTALIASLVDGGLLVIED